MPSLEAVTSRLAHLFREARNEQDDCELALAKLKANQDALDCIAILSCRKAMDIPVKTKDCTYRLFKCQAADCVQIVAKKYRSDNELLCEHCKVTKFNTVRNDRNREKRGDNVFQLNSKSNLRYLKPEQLSQRGKLCYKERKRQEREIVRLTKEVARLKERVKMSVMTFDGSDGTDFLRNSHGAERPGDGSPLAPSGSTPPPARPSNASPSNPSAEEKAKTAEVESATIENEAFLKELLTISKGITDNEKLFSGVARKIVIKVLRQGFENEKKSSECEFHEDDVTDMVDFFHEAIEKSGQNIK